MKGNELSRYLVAHSLKFNRKRHPDEAVAPSNLEGTSLLAHIGRYCEKCVFGETRDEFRQTMIEQQSFQMISDEVCLLKLAVAKWGEESRVLDPGDYGKVSYFIKKDEPVSTVTRALCSVPKNGEAAFFFSEYADGVSAGMGFLRLFQHDFVRSVPTVTLKASRVFGADEWLKTATLLELKIRVKKRAADNADYSNIYSGALVYEFRPDKKTLWGSKTLDRILGKNENERSQVLVEIAEDFGIDLADSVDSIDGKLTLKGQDGRNTTFSLGDDPRAPYLYTPINNRDGSELSDNDFIQKCEELAADYASRG